MKHQLEYRIGQLACYSTEQWSNASGKTTDEIVKSLSKTVPARYLYDIYAVIVDQNGEIVKISKHPCQVIQQESEEAMRAEIARYAEANSKPIFDRDAFSSYDYFIINSDDITSEFVQNTIYLLDAGTY